MAFYLHTDYDWLALAPDDDPGVMDIDVDIPNEPAISEERTAAFWDIFGALWLTNPNPRQAPESDAPLRNGVVSDVGIGVDYQRFILASPLAAHARLEEADTTHDMVEDLNDKVLADTGTISALQHAVEYLARRQDEDRRRFHDDLAVKQVIIDSMAEQMAYKDLAIMDLHRTAQATTLRHDGVLDTMHDEAAAKQRAIDELKSELDESAKERAQQQLELIALCREVSQLKDANSELTSVNSALKTDLDKLADAVAQLFPGSNDEEDDEDDEDHDDEDDDGDPRDQHAAISPSPMPRTVSRIPRWTYLLKYPKKPLLTTTLLLPRVIKPDAALTPATMQPDAVVLSSPPLSKSKIRSADTFTGVRRRRLPLQKTPIPKFTSTSTNISTRTSTIASPNKIKKKLPARKSFRF